jgi:hypothetical protein
MIVGELAEEGRSVPHQRYRYADGRRVTVTYHQPGDTFPTGTLRSMIEIQTQWPEPFSSPLNPGTRTPAPKGREMPASTRARDRSAEPR